MTDFLTISLSFLGTICFGITAVLLKKADVDSVYFGLFIRALSSVPVVIILSLFINGSQIMFEFDLFLLIYVSLASITLMLADITIMWILKEKSVGIIAPLIAIFPLFTSFFFIITGFTLFTPFIFLFTVLIVIGVSFVTYNKHINSEDAKITNFDKKALFYGLIIAFFIGLSNFIDAVIINDYDLDGLSYTTLKFGILLLFSVIIYVVFEFGEINNHLKNRESTLYLIIAGIIAWGFGSILVYTSYDLGDANIVNAIIGINPIFAVLLSLILGMEKLNLHKIFGLIICVCASIGIVNL